MCNFSYPPARRPTAKQIRARAATTRSRKSTMCCALFFSSFFQRCPFFPRPFREIMTIYGRSRCFLASHDDAAAYQGALARSHSNTTHATSDQNVSARIVPLVENMLTVLLLPLSGVLFDVAGDSTHKCLMSEIGFSMRRNGDSAEGIRTRYSVGSFRKGTITRVEILVPH